MPRARVEVFGRTRAAAQSDALEIEIDRRNRLPWSSPATRLPPSAPLESPTLRSASSTESWCNSTAKSSDAWIAVVAFLNARSRSCVSGSGCSGTRSPRTHEWLSSSAAVIRFSGSFSSMRATSSFARPETPFHASESKE